MVAKWPQVTPEFLDTDVEHSFQVISEYVREIRRVKHDFGIPLKSLVPIQIELGASANVFEVGQIEFQAMANIDPDQLVISKKIKVPDQAAHIVLHGITAYIPLHGIIDLEAEKARMQKKIAKVEKQIEKISKKLSGDFSQRAPKELVDKEKEKLTDAEHKKAQMNDQLKMIS
jgi:valyl-tRNA synthetase